MAEKTVTPLCPWCGIGFMAQIDDKYEDAEAIPEGGELAADEGYNQSCPNPKCERLLFIRYKS
jgi:hypothetical protein